MEDVAAIVLAAGKGVRMRSALPKVLHEALGAPLIRFALDAVDAAGAARKVVVVGAEREAIERRLAELGGPPAGAAIEYATQSEPRGTGHAVLAARQALDGFHGTVLVVCGDAPLLKPETLRTLLDLHRREGSDATVLTAELRDPRGYGRILRDSEGRISAIVEEKDASDAQRATREVNSGTYAFRADSLWPAAAELKPDNSQKELYLTDIVRILLAYGRTVGTCRAADSTEVLGVNSRKELAAAVQQLRLRLIDRHLDAGATIVDPTTTWIEADCEIGPDTVIEPFTIIRRGARIGARCHVGPFAHLQTGVVPEDEAEIGNFVEVKRTRVRRGAKAKHLAYLGDGDLGEKANVGAGTILCNYDGKRKSKTTNGERAFIGSGSLLVAPCEIGPGATTGAGAVVTRGKKVPAGETWAGVPARAIRAKPATGSGTGTGTGTDMGGETA